MTQPPCAHRVPAGRLPRFPVFLLVALLVVVTGCGDARDRAVLKQAGQVLAAGDPKKAAEQTKGVLQRSPRNILALRLLRKVKSHLIKKANSDVRAQNYQAALDGLQVLLELEPDHKKAQALQIVAKKNLLLVEARDAQSKQELGTALEKVNGAIKVDPEFGEAKELLATLMEQRDDEVRRLLAQAPALLQGDDPGTVVEEMQQVLKMDQDNVQAQEFLREAQVALLAKQKAENLEAARAFYQEARYEAAIEKAQAILAVDPSSYEAKTILERSQAESTRPELRLTGISVIRGIPTAAVEIPSLGERMIAREGDDIGPYQVQSIDVPSKTVYMEFVPTGSILPYTTARE